jgi:hypothetical protein
LTSPARRHRAARHPRELLRERLAANDKGSRWFSGLPAFPL